MGKLERFVPAAQWLGRYERRYLGRDLAGGLAVGSMLIPQGLAFAQLVHVPPVAGLWSGIAARLFGVAELEGDAVQLLARGDDLRVTSAMLKFLSLEPYCSPCK